MSNQNQFNHVIRKKLNYARHNLSYHNMLTAEFGAIIPFYLEDDLVPGDKARINSAILAKFAPFINPVYAEINILTEYYFVPYRILQPNYIKTMSGGESGTDFPNRSKITANATQLATYGQVFLPGSLSDYLGINLGTEFTEELKQGAITNDRQLIFNSYRHKAYQFIYNEYYRDQNLTNPIDIPFDDLDVPLTTQNLDLFDIRYSAWKKDYFTSALPFAQRGSAMGVPIDGDGQVYYTYVPSPDAAPTLRYFNSNSQVASSQALYTNANGNPISKYYQQMYAYNSNGSDKQLTQFEGTTYGSSQLAYDPGGTLRVDLNQASLLIENLRIASSIQQFMELKARSGGRDREFLFGQFGVDNKDMRLTIPQLIGGGVQNVVLSEILQQSQSTSTSPQGTRSGDANSFGSHGLFRDFYVTEPGLIMGVMRILPKAQYCQGISRHLMKFDWSDDFNPFFQHLGEQPIKRGEIYFTGTDVDEQTFGYAPRYAEYKWHEGEIHGDFKTSLDTWHVGRMFPSNPVLNTNFIEVRPDDVNRIFAVQKDDDGNNLESARIWLEVYNQANFVRPIMKDAIPQLI